MLHAVAHNQRDSTPEERFGRAVRAARESRRWSQEELSYLLKAETQVTIDQSGVARIESGKRAVRLNEVVALSRLLGIHFSTDSHVEDHAMDERLLAEAENELAKTEHAMDMLRARIEERDRELTELRAQMARLAVSRDRVQTRVARIRQLSRDARDLAAEIESGSDGDR